MKLSIKLAHSAAEMYFLALPVLRLSICLSACL